MCQAMVEQQWERAVTGRFDHEWAVADRCGYYVTEEFSDLVTEWLGHEVWRQVDADIVEDDEPDVDMFGDSPGVLCDMPLWVGDEVRGV